MFLKILYILNFLSVIVVIFLEYKKPLEALLWVIVLTVIPGGLVLYSIFGSTLWIKVTYKLRSGRINKEFHDNLRHFFAKEDTQQYFDAFSEAQRDTALFNFNNSNSYLAINNSVDIITNGKVKYERLFADIRNAKKSINIVYYGLHNDKVGREFLALLTEKAKEGVVVRVLYDGVGSFLTPRYAFRALRHAGGQVKRIKSIWTHFRNHRKIVVIDGIIGYTGGMNIGKKYLGELKNKSPWRDTQIRMEGDAVYYLQYYFLYDWFYAHRRPRISEDDVPGLFPPHSVSDELICQVIGCGVETDQDGGKLAYIRMINAAKKRIVVQSPYFVPNSSLLNALRIAAASGIEVILMLPGRKSSFFLEPASHSYIDQILPYGVKVFLYDGYIHAKTMTIDDTITCIGTLNIDVRSMELDDELCVIFYDHGFIKKHQAVLDDDLKHCVEMDYDAFQKRGLWKKAAERFFRLFSPLL